MVTFHLPEGGGGPEQEKLLLERASALYCDVLRAPAGRVRALIASYAAGRCAVAGAPVSRPGDGAAFFEFFVLNGRSEDERRRLAAGFTDLLVEVLGASRELVRGCCRQIAPEDWFIAGVSADVARADEIRARAAAAGAVGSHGGETREPAA